MVGALYFTYTRSALYALGLGVLALVLFLKTRVRGEMVIGVVLVAVFVIETTGILNTLQIGGRSATNQEESALSRPILWQAGIAIALDNPILGIGGDQFSRISPQYAGAVDPSLLQWEEERYWSYQTLGNEPPHNDFLNMWISYGTLALLAYVWLYFVIMRNLFDAYVKSKKRFLKGLSIGLGAGLVAYAGNAFYHNLMITLPLLWILAGLSLATCKLASGEVGGPKLSAAVGR
jgi:O-antigen ligase